MIIYYCIYIYIKYWLMNRGFDCGFSGDSTLLEVSSPPLKDLISPRQILQTGRWFHRPIRKW